MKKVLITKVQRFDLATKLGTAIAETFNVKSQPAVHVPCYGGGRHMRCLVSTTSVRTSAGDVTMSVEVSSSLVSVFCCFDQAGPLTDAQRGMAIRLGGNQYSGKMNFHGCPDNKLTDRWRDDCVSTFRCHCEAMLRDR